MLQTEILSTHATRPAPSVIGLEPKRLPPTQKSPEPIFETTPRAIRMDGSHLSRELHEVAVGQMVEALRMAEFRKRSELLICNIAPWVKVGKSDVTRVPETQDRVMQILSDACDYLGRDIPEARLTLHFGEFDIRCYLGREKPTDHVYEEDWISDSR